LSATTAYLLYAIFALGGIGLYCLMPPPQGARTLVGVVVGAATSITGSGGESLEVETTSLAILAWLSSPKHTGNVETAIRWLGGRCKGGRFGATQSTILALKAIGLPLKASAGVAIAATSLVFALAHYQWDFHLAGLHFATPNGDVFDWYSFSFRALAGGFFSLLFVCRGFGIAVGAHALYDVLVLAM